MAEEDPQVGGAQSALDAMYQQDPTLRVRVAMATERPPTEEDQQQIGDAARSEGVRPEVIAQRRRHGRFLQESVRAGLTHQQARDLGEQHFGADVSPDVYRRAQQEHTLNQNRQSLAGAEESPWTYIARRAIPFGSAIRNFMDSRSYTQSLDRYKQGTASEGDLSIIAQYERLQHLDANQTTGQAIASGLATMPAMVGEAMLGGAALRGLGIGAQAATAGRMGAAAAPGLAARGGAFAATVASMPSMYLAQAAQRNVEQGRDAGDWRGFPAAVTMAAMQVAVLGSLGKFGNSITGSGVLPVAQRYLTRTATGLAEQHGFVEPLAEAVSLALPEAYRLETGHGLLSNAFRGNWGEAWKQLAVSTVTFAAFSGLHEAQQGAPSAREVIGSAEAAMQHMAQAGIPRAQIPERLAEIKSWIERGHARQLVEQLPPGPLRDYAMIQVKATTAARQAQANEAAAQNLPELANRRMGWDPTAPTRSRMEKIETAPPAFPSPAGRAETAAPPPGSHTQPPPREAAAPEPQRPADQREAAAASHPLAGNLEASLAERFKGNERMTRLGENGKVEHDILWKDPKGKDRQIFVDLDPQKQTVKIDFEHIILKENEDAYKVGKKFEAGSLAFAKKITEIIKWAKDNGVGIIAEGKIDIDKKTGAVDRTRQQSYDSMLEKAGLKKGDDGAWRKPGAASSGEAAPGIQGAVGERAPGAQPVLSRLERMTAKARGTVVKPTETPVLSPTEQAKTAKAARVAKEKAIAETIARDEAEHARMKPALEAVEKHGRGETLSKDERNYANRTFDFTDTEAKVFWALRGPEPTTQVEVAKRMGMTASRIQQLEKRANEKVGLERSAFADRLHAKAANVLAADATTAGPAMTGTVTRKKAKGEPIDQVIDMLTAAKAAGVELAPERIGQLLEAPRKSLVTMAKELEDARKSILSDAGQSPSLRKQAEEGIRDSIQAAQAAAESEAGAGVRGEEAGRPAAERGTVAPADRPTDAPAPAERSPTGTNVVAQPEGALPTPSVQGLLFGEQGTFVPQQFLQNFGQKMKALGTLAHDFWLNNLAPSLRAEEVAKPKGYKPGVGQGLFTRLSWLLNYESPLAAEYKERGIWAMDNGQRVTIGKPIAKIMEPFKANREDITKPVEGPLAQQTAHWFAKDELVTRFDVYATARSIYEEHMAGQSVVPNAWFHEAKQVLQQFQADPAFVARALPVHNDLIEHVYNASLLARAAPEVHNITRGDADHYIDKHKAYIEFRRGLAEGEFKDFQGGFRSSREHMAGSIKAREEGGSDRGIVPPLKTAMQRLDQTARIVTEQMRRNAWENLFSTPGLTELSEVMPPGTNDSRLPLFHWTDPFGKVQTRQIKDKSMYELATNIQGNASPVVQMFRALASIDLGTGTPILPAINTIVKAGATTFSMGFQARNLIRDAYTFASNTIDQGSVRHIPEMLARMYGAEMGRLMGKVSNDVIFKEIKELRGEAAREQPLGGTSAPGGIREIKTWLDLATQALRVAGAGELAPRAIEMRTRYEQLGWSEARLKREIEAAEKAPGPYRDPVPFDVRMEVAKAMRESTVDFGRGGILTNEINKITPFFRPAVNGLWKQLNNWQSNTKGAAIALAAYLGLKLTHWLANQDKEWWPNLSAYDRYNNFVVEIGGKLYRIPGARDLEIPVSGLMIAMLDQGAKRNPQWAGLMKQSLEAVAPPALPAPVALAWQLRGNEDFMGRPIIPKRDEHLPASYNLWHHQVPYGVRQLTGGRGEVSAAGLTGLSPTVTPTVQLGQYYDALHGLEERRTLAKREGTVFRQEAEYRRLHGSAVAARITALGKEYQKATEDRRSAIRREQNRLAAILLR